MRKFAHFPRIRQRLQIHLVHETEKTQTPENFEISYHMYGETLHKVI